MDEKELQDQLAELRDRWRIPREVPLGEMWQTIEAQVFGPGRGQRRSPRLPHSPWVRTILPMAATLILGFGVGQLAPALFRPGPAASVSEANQAQPQPVGEPAPPAPFVGVANNYLERVTALLVTLTDETARGRPLNYSSEQARDLLATTRLLLDSPETTDPHLRDLLDDLELVLAQIVRLPRRAPAPDVYLIDQALDQRDVLPRLRVMLAENPTSAP